MSEVESEEARRRRPGAITRQITFSPVVVETVKNCFRGQYETFNEEEGERGKEEEGGGDEEVLE